jgi:hypothetical protein
MLISEPLNEGKVGHLVYLTGSLGAPCIYHVYMQVEQARQQGNTIFGGFLRHAVSSIFLPGFQLIHYTGKLPILWHFEVDLVTTLRIYPVFDL